MDNVNVKKISLVTLMFGLSAAQSPNFDISTNFGPFPTVYQFPTTASSPNLNGGLNGSLTSALIGGLNKTGPTS
jgi:hypothetical protein